MQGPTGAMPAFKNAIRRVSVHGAVRLWQTGEGAMQYERLYADPSGETHFDKVLLKLDEADYQPPAPMVFVSQPLSRSNSRNSDTRHGRCKAA